MKVQTLKSTVLWFEPLAGRLEGEGSPEAHQRKLAAALAKGAGLPWRSDSVSSFWRYYLECNPPSRVSSWKAWDRLVPWKGVGTGDQIEPKELEGSFQIESFFYPHGIGLAVSVRIEEELSLARMVDRAREILKKNSWKVDWRKDGIASLPLIASKLLDDLKGEDGKAEGPGRTDPFYITTILRGEEDSRFTVSDGKPSLDLWRALQGLCTLRPRWEREDLRRLRPCQLRLRSGSGAENLLFAVGRGRALWFPGAFTATGTKNRTLGCYHRNLVLASMQTESLLQAVVLAEQALNQGSLSVRMEEVARRAALRLGLLYSGQGSYGSWSVVEQIEHDRSLRETIGVVRDYFGMPRLRRQEAEERTAAPTAPTSKPDVAVPA